MRGVVPVVSAIVLLGCASSPMPAPRSVPRDALDAAFLELVRDLEPLGVHRHASERRFLLPGESFSHPVTVPAGGCRTWTVLASEGLRDVDATLYTSDGDALARDVESDAHPTIQLCAGVDARLFLHLSAYEGAGEMLIAEFESPRSIDVTPVVGGRPVIAVLEDHAEREVMSALRQRWFRPADSVREIELPLVDGETRTEILASLRVRRGRCYAAVAAAPQGLIALDVRRSGATLAREGASPVTAAQWCADVSGSVDIALSGPPGTHVRLWILDAEEARVGGEAGLWLGQRP